jgi:hypothetical protein
MITGHTADRIWIGFRNRALVTNRAGRIVKSAIGRVVDRFKPDRDVLGDYDESEWPFDYNGKQSDPWVNTVYIPMVTRSGEALFTFSTHSFFGREAAYRLFKHYAAQAPQHPNCFPVVRLGTTTNPTKKYGDIDSPELPIVDWQDRPQQAIASIPPIDEVDDGSRAWVKEYNETRPHQGRWCYGKTPLQTFLDALPIPLSASPGKRPRPSRPGAQRSHPSVAVEKAPPQSSPASRARIAILCHCHRAVGCHNATMANGTGGLVIIFATDIDVAEIVVELAEPGPLIVGMKVDVYFRHNGL